MLAALHQLLHPILVYTAVSLHIHTTATITTTSTASSADWPGDTAVCVVPNVSEVLVVGLEVHECALDAVVERTRHL